jgi:cysteinyl-tRNA synthetase
MPVALALLREILRAPLLADERRWLILDADFVLGLDLDRVWEEETGAAPRDDGTVPHEVRALLAERDAARAAKDYARADELRDALAGLGWDVIDGSDGSRATRRGPEATG